MNPPAPCSGVARDASSGSEAMAACGSAGDAAKLLQFIRFIGQLKRVPRTGWVYRNVKKPESVSDHMYRMAVMAFLIEDQKLNKERCIKLALVHDMAECIVGDIAPADNISKEEKHRREEEAMKRLTGLLSNDASKEILELWQEYENQSSNEAKYVKELDRFEMIVQAFEYEEMEEKHGHLQEFYDSTKGKFHHPEILQLVATLNAERDSRETKGSHRDFSGECVDALCL
ncbi:HD domain-containing protein 2 [Pristis pectinata]|uniref:HD domain-containing protein 2 n=1 Tax=Pristis pectinata TaxID=685728 RepID=UPI00223D8F5C|nr:HD domain-containing protein 2 [Pristis pectinata]